MRPAASDVGVVIERRPKYTPGRYVPHCNDVLCASEKCCSALLLSKSATDGPARGVAAAAAVGDDRAGFAGSWLGVCW